MALRTVAWLLWLSPLLAVFLMTAGQVNASNLLQDITPACLTIDKLTPKQLHSCDSSVNNLLPAGKFCAPKCEGATTKRTCGFACKNKMATIEYCNTCGLCISAVDLQIAVRAIEIDCVDKSNFPGQITSGGPEDLFVYKYP